MNDETFDDQPDDTDDEAELNHEDFDISDDTSEMSDIINDNWEEGVVEDTPSITCVEQYTINYLIKFTLMFCTMF